MPGVSVPAACSLQGDCGDCELYECGITSSPVRSSGYPAACGGERREGEKEGGLTRMIDEAFHLIKESNVNTCNNIICDSKNMPTQGLCECVAHAISR